ncbi:CopD family protein [Halorarius halobius]|uniref:CopD family protein n=1 Tax=Halorarius halobius TaxID=2962671 RepID=UPI0020CEDE95|nr:CopD family protein [Halorarius halobius]
MVSSLHVGVRLLHVTAVALLTGGAALLWLAASRTVAADESSFVVSLAVGYEWLFWAGAGALVATGVGNLGALAPAVPPLDTRWGLVLAVKLLAVLGFLLGSAVRTATVDRLASARPPAAVTRVLSRAYATTTLALVGLLALAEVLAHG